MNPADARLRSLTALWRRALAGPQHAGGCSCFGGFTIAAPSPRELEEDVLDYLRQRYRADDDIGVRLLARETALQAGATPDFPGFLATLAREVSAATGDRLLTDVTTTLTSLAGPAPGSGPGASRFACT